LRGDTCGHTTPHHTRHETHSHFTAEVLRGSRSLHVQSGSRRLNPSTPQYCTYAPCSIHPLYPCDTVTNPLTRSNTVKPGQTLMTHPNPTCSLAMCLSRWRSKNCRVACSAGSTTCPVSGCTTTPAGLLEAAEQQEPYPAAARAAAGGGGRRPWMEASTLMVAVLTSRTVLSV
jgi:hypothetical protein